MHVPEWSSQCLLALLISAISLISFCASVDADFL